MICPAYTNPFDIVFDASTKAAVVVSSVVGLVLVFLELCTIFSGATLTGLPCYLSTC
jgi:hypothetical protein